MDLSTAANDPRPFMSFWALKNPQCIQRVRFRFFRACGLACGSSSFASSRTPMSDRLLGGRDTPH